MTLSGSMRLTSVNHLTYNVKDKERATKFWTEVLGVKRIPSQVNAEHIVWLQLPSGTMVHLIENKDGISVPSHHAAFEVEDIDKAFETLKAKGVQMASDSVGVRNDGQRVFFILDTEGNRVEICTKSGFGVLV
ncbi:MAG: VOC family protein [Chloroflexi bacterium]|nr:VOC family protein [Chloroflexota bacterium]